MALPISPFDQDPKLYRAGEVYEVAPGQTGGIHDHEIPAAGRKRGKSYRHSHEGWDSPHTHERNAS